MSKHRFPSKAGGEVILDLCFPCQGIWFDEYESLQIAPGGIIELFKLIHAHRDDLRQPLTDALRCPRCDDRLLHGLDVVKPGGRFSYHRCLQGHGRFNTFGQFMIEKGFVRQLTPLEITTLSAKVGIINCSGCGAPVDVRHEVACSHCKAAIAILDPEAVEQALARYQSAEVKRQSPPNLDLLADAILMRESQKSAKRRESRLSQIENLEVGDLLVAGVGLVIGLLKN